MTPINFHDAEFELMTEPKSFHDAEMHFMSPKIFHDAERHFMTPKNSFHDAVNDFMTPRKSTFRMREQKMAMHVITTRAGKQVPR